MGKRYLLFTDDGHHHDIDQKLYLYDQYSQACDMFIMSSLAGRSVTMFGWNNGTNEPLHDVICQMNEHAGMDSWEIERLIKAHSENASFYYTIDNYQVIVSNSSLNGEVKERFNLQAEEGKRSTEAFWKGFLGRTE